MFFNLLFTCELMSPPCRSSHFYVSKCGSCSVHASKTKAIIAEELPKSKGGVPWGSRKSHDNANRASVSACVLHVVVEMLLAGGDHIPRVLPEGGAQLAQGRGGHRRRQEAPHVRRAHVQDGGRPGSPSPVSTCFVRK